MKRSLSQPRRRAARPAQPAVTAARSERVKESLSHQWRPECLRHTVTG